MLTPSEGSDVTGCWVLTPSEVAVGLMTGVVTGGDLSLCSNLAMVRR